MTASKDKENLKREKAKDSGRRHDNKAAKDKEKAEKKSSKQAQDAQEQAASTAEKETAAAVDESYLRLKADFDNYRKRVLREKDEIYRRANQDIIEELLPVLDHLDMALDHAGDDENPVVQGFRMVGDQLRNALQKFGLNEVDADGCEFDPNLHEAIVHMPSEEVDENRIVNVTRKGYKLGDRLLRASQVVVSSGSSDPDADE